MIRFVFILLIALVVSALVQTHAEADWLHDQKDSFVLGVSCVDGEWLKHERSKAYVDEAKRRGLSCGVSGTKSTQTSTLTTNQSNTASKAGQRLSTIRSMSDSTLCIYASASTKDTEYVQEAIRRGVSCGAVVEYANGDKYEGVLINNKRNGQGVLTYANGDKFVGEFSDGLRHGPGTLTSVNSQKVEGEWREGHLKGLVKVTSPDGYQMIGDTVDEKLNGPVFIEFEGKGGVLFFDDGEAKPFEEVKISSFNNHKKLTADELESIKSDGVVRHPVDHVFSYRCEETSNQAPGVTKVKLVTKNPKYTIDAQIGIVSKVPNSGGLEEMFIADHNVDEVKSGLVKYPVNDKFSIVGKKITLFRGFEGPKTTDFTDAIEKIFNSLISDFKMTDLGQSKLIPVKYTKYQNMVSLQTNITYLAEIVLEGAKGSYSITAKGYTSDTIHLESGVVVESTGSGSVVSMKKDGKDQPVPSEFKNVETKTRCVLVDKVPVE